MIPAYVYVRVIVLVETRRRYDGTDTTDCIDYHAIFVADTYGMPHLVLTIGRHPNCVARVYCANAGPKYVLIPIHACHHA